MPTVYMMIGLPASGKSTYIKEHFSGVQVVSSDDLIESRASALGQTYDEVFSDFINIAASMTKARYSELLANGEDIILDRTNLTKKVRERWIKEAKAHGYEVIAYHFDVCSERLPEWSSRLTSREGKTIPENILCSMIKNEERPSKSEGFDDIRDIDTFFKF